MATMASPTERTRRLLTLAGELADGKSTAA
jgi:hypothetical protein